MSWPPIVLFKISMCSDGYSVIDMTSIVSDGYDTNVNKDRLIVKTMKFYETNQNDQHETQMRLEMNSFSTNILLHQILKNA